jgi:hypothetical protein
MPYRTIGLDKVARKLHLSRVDVERLVENQEIPSEKYRNRPVFRLRPMAQKAEVLAEFRQASTSDAKYEVMINSELTVLESQPDLDHAFLPRA